jgi:hypothetical protein
MTTGELTYYFFATFALVGAIVLAKWFLTTGQKIKFL